MWNEATITDVGTNLLAAWVSGRTLNLSRAAAGSGTCENMYTATALTSEKQELSIVSAHYDQEANGVLVKLQATAALTAYTMHEIGIWGTVDGNEVMLALYHDNVGIHVPAISSSPQFVYNFFGVIICDNTGTLTVNIDQTAFITMETMLEVLEDKQDKVTVFGMLKRDENGNIVAAIPGEDYDIPQLSSGSYTGTCSVAGGTAMKTLQIEELTELMRGQLFVIWFTNANTALNPSLKINDLPAAAIVSPGQSSFQAADNWGAGEYVLFLWNGTNFVYLHHFIRFIPLAQRGTANGVATLESDGKLTPSQLRAGTFTGVCSTAKATSQKVVTISDMADLYVGSLITIQFMNANSAVSPTLKVNNLTAGRIVSPGLTTFNASDSWAAGEHVMFLWDGSYFVLVHRSAGYVPISDKGSAGGVATLDADGKISVSQLRAGTFVGTCDTIAGTSQKQCTVDGCTALVTGTLFSILFSKANSFANYPKLKINTLPAYNIVSPGQSTHLSDDDWGVNEYVLFVWTGSEFVQLYRTKAYIPKSEKGVAGGVATLEPDGKVTPSQLRGGFIVQASAPTDETLLWIDSNRVMRYFDSTTQTWRTILPTWG